MFARHLTTACLGPMLAAEVMREHEKGGVPMEAQWRNVVSEAAAGKPSRARGHVERQVGPPRKPVVGSMLGYLRRGEIGGAQQEEDAVGEEAGIRTRDVGDAGAAVDGASLEGEGGGVGLPEASAALDVAVGVERCV